MSIYAKKFPGPIINYLQIQYYYLKQHCINEKHKIKNSYVLFEGEIDLPFEALEQEPWGLNKHLYPEE